MDSNNIAKTIGVATIVTIVILAIGLLIAYIKGPLPQLKELIIDNKQLKEQVQQLSKQQDVLRVEFDSIEQKRDGTLVKVDSIVKKRKQRAYEDSKKYSAVDSMSIDSIAFQWRRYTFGQGFY